jgi:hypothetical protein
MSNVIRHNVLPGNPDKKKLLEPIVGFCGYNHRKDSVVYAQDCSKGPSSNCNAANSGRTVPPIDANLRQSALKRVVFGVIPPDSAGP